MQIDNDITGYCVNDSEPVGVALERLNENKQKILFLVNDFGVLTGVFSDGDFRRWVVSSKSIDLKTKVYLVANKQFVSASEASLERELSELFSEKISVLPLIDPDGKLVSIARPGKKPFSIGDFNLNDKAKSFVIAEIGNNHNGSLQEAKKLVDSAVESGADCVKFQMRDVESLYVNSGNPCDASADLGTQYILDLLSKFQLSDDEFKELFEYCRRKKVIALCTPFDKSSVDKLESLDIPAYKVASADLTNHDLLGYLASKGKPLIVSTGMSSESEIVLAVEFLRRRGANFALLHCNSTYPTPFDNVNLSYIKRLREISDGVVGYSGHERGWSVPVAAVALGAQIIEKHFTHDKSQEGNDHKVSLLPSEFQGMVEAIRNVEMSLGSASPRKIDQGEMMNRESLAKSIVCNMPIKAGEIITSKHLRVASPGKGLQPYFKDQLIGKVAVRNLNIDDFFYESDLGEGRAKPRKYNFDTQFGLPVRYHDFESIVNQTNLDFVEFHLSYNDLNVNIGDYLGDKDYPVKCIVHAPELFEGDHTLDLCSVNEDYRNRSINELQRVIDISNTLKRSFTNSMSDVAIVVNVGGFSENGFISAGERTELYSILIDSLNKLDMSGVEVIPQTMPPFPWHFGGQRHHNLFVQPQEIIDWCDRYGFRICLDVSHTALACNYYGLDFHQSIDSLSPYVAHLHVADACGSKEEGLQIFEGDVDFEAIFRLMKSKMHDATWLPEIWQGHKNGGEGFWKALDRLEKLSSV